jgi:hypothetical protein
MRCKLNAKALPRQAETTAIAKRLKQEGKRPVHGHFARAIQRRGLDLLVGLEAADTKFIPPIGGAEALVKSQWWAYSWVRYMYDSQRSDTKKTYCELQRIATLSPEDQEATIHMLLLASVNS